MTDQITMPVQTIDLSQYIETRIFDDRPHIRNRRVPVAFIAYNAYRNGWDVPYLAYAFTLSETQVLAALLYYIQNKEHIDALEAAEQAELDRLYELHKNDGWLLIYCTF